MPRVRLASRYFFFCNRMDASWGYPHDRKGSRTKLRIEDLNGDAMRMDWAVMFFLGFMCGVGLMGALMSHLEAKRHQAPKT